MINISNPLHMSIILYIFVLLALYIIKPRLCFDENGKMKAFGCGYSSNTLFPFHGISIIFAIFTYFVFF